MKTSKLLLSMLAMTAFLAGEANAKGCLTGAAVGGTAGHFAGKHAVVGAGVGCAIGRHRANKKDRAAAATQSPAPAVASSPATAPVGTAAVPSK